MISTNLKKDRFIKCLLWINIVLSCAPVLYYLLFMKYNIFSDFSEVMQFALSGNPYNAPFSSSYPPLAILINYPFALICRNVINLKNFEIIQTPQFWISFFLFYVIFFAAAALLFKKLVKIRGKSFACFLLAALSSGMILFMVIRGNIILSALVFLLFFLAFYNNKNKVLRELALISLALAGTIKIYPLFFGVLLLKDKKFFSAARVAAYSIILFFVPFLFFEGNFFANISLFFNNLGDFSSSNNRMLRSMSSTGIVYNFFELIEPLFNVSLKAASQIVSIIIIAIITVVAIIGSLLSKSKLSAYVICATAILLIPTVSYYYSAIFLLIPLAEFLNEYETLTATRKRFYLIFFIAVCSFFFYYSLTILGLLLIVALFYESVKNINNKLNKNIVLITDRF